MTSTRLLLVRHGESTWNTEGRWQGHADPPLSSLGARQAAAAAGIAVPVDAVWTSDLIRAARTAEILATRLGLDGPRADTRLRERDVGEWTGLTRADIEERWPGHLEARRSPPGFEPDSSIVARAMAALHDIAGETEAATAVIVTHGGVVRAVERHLGAEPAPVPNLAGRWIVFDPEPTLGERCLLIDPDDVEVTIPPPH